MTYPPEPDQGSDWSNPGGQWGSPDHGGYSTPPPVQYGGPSQPPPPSFIPAQPGIIPLRPLTLGQIFDGAFKSLRANPMVMFVFAGVIIISATIIELVLSAPFYTGYTSMLDLLSDDPTFAGSVDSDDLLRMFTGTITPMIVGAIMSVIASTILTGVLTFAVSQSVLGYKPTVGQVWDQVKGQVLRLIGLILLIGAISFVVPALLLGFVILVGSSASPGATALIGLFALLVGGVWVVFVNIAATLATPALMLERCGPITALRRSWQLTRPYFWRVLGIVLLTGLITSLVASVVVTPLTLFALALPPTGLLILQGIGSAIASTLITPFTAAVVALLYIDIRIRREGLAAELAAAAAQ